MSKTKEAYSEAKSMFTMLCNKINMFSMNLQKAINMKKIKSGYINFNDKIVSYKVNGDEYIVSVSKEGFNVRVLESDIYTDFNFFKHFEILKNTDKSDPYYEKLKDVLNKVSAYVPREVDFINITGLFADICFGPPLNKYYTTISDNKFMYYEKKSYIIDKFLKAGANRHISILPFPLIVLSATKRWFSREFNKLVEEIESDPILKRNYKLIKMRSKYLIYIY